MRRLFFVLLCMVISVTAHAHRGEYIVEHGPEGEIIYEKVTVTFDVLPSDVGLRGDFYIVLEDEGSGNYYVNVQKEWVALERLSTVVSFEEADPLPSSLSAVLWETYTKNHPQFAINMQLPEQRGTLCSKLNEHGITRPNFWIGYGALQPDKAERVDNYHRHANRRIDPNHIRRTYIFNDGLRNEKYEKVLSINCAPAIGG